MKSWSRIVLSTSPVSIRPFLAVLPKNQTHISMQPTCNNAVTIMHIEAVNVKYNKNINKNIYNNNNDNNCNNYRHNYCTVNYHTER